MQGVAAGAGLVSEHEAGGFALQPADELVDVGLAGADGAEEGDLGRAFLGGVGDGDGILVDVETDEERGGVMHG